MGKLNTCKHYDAELDCCKELSDWSNPMPVLAPCSEVFCPERKPTPPPKKSTMSGFTNGNKDDFEKAVDGLAIFCHNWCMNVKETEEKEDLVFRCKICPFEDGLGYCNVKRFINKYGTEEQKQSATSMC